MCVSSHFTYTDSQVFTVVPVKGEASACCIGEGELANLDFSRVMWEGNLSSQLLSSLKSTDRNTPAVLFSSKDAAMRWNMGSTCNT